MKSTAYGKNILNLQKTAKLKQVSLGLHKAIAAGHASLSKFQVSVFSCWATRSILEGLQKSCNNKTQVLHPQK